MIVYIEINWCTHIGLSWFMSTKRDDKLISVKISSLNYGFVNSNLDLNHLFPFI